jgi:hypothetical protein
MKYQATRSASYYSSLQPCHLRRLDQMQLSHILEHVLHQLANSGDPQEHLILFAKDQVANQINRRWQLIQVQSMCRRKKVSLTI